MSQSLRYILTGAGCFFVGLGVIGIFVPLLPTTPFLLLAAACFVRSSETLHRRLVEHPQLGRLILDYQRHRSIPLRAKIMAIAMLWLMIATSAYFFVSLLWVKGLLFAIALGVTLYILSLKTSR